MHERWFLLKQFLRHPIQVGAIAPSSPALCRELVCWLEAEKSNAIAELGPGTGVVTREILQHKAPDCRFFAVELDKDICEELRSELPELDLYNADASFLADICRQSNIAELDAVVSGLPWAAFPAELQHAILSAITKSLKKGGKFSTFAYLQGMVLPAGWRFRHLLEKYFSQVEISEVVWKNLPPAVVYRCVK